MTTTTTSNTKKKMKNKDVIFFSVNNWFPGRDYPDTPNFKKWLGNDLNQRFSNDDWCKENKLCVYAGVIDMSFNYTISAPKEWVEKNCPELLTDDEYTYILRETRHKKHIFGKPEVVWVDVEYKKKYSDFVYTPEDGEDTPDNDEWDMPFREYKEENFGSQYYETNYWDDVEENDEEETEED